MQHILALYNKKIYNIMEAYDLPRATAFLHFYQQMYPKAQFDFISGLQHWQLEKLLSPNQFARDYNKKEYLRVIEHVG